jgi:hypothetical protein
MDVLSAMFRAAKHAGVLAELMAAGLEHRVSLYVDDIVVFARPKDGELVGVRDILECFGAASGLEVNYTKSSIAPIRCSETWSQGWLRSCNAQLGRSHAHISAFPCPSDR